MSPETTLKENKRRGTTIVILCLVILLTVLIAYIIASVSGCSDGGITTVTDEQDARIGPTLDLQQVDLYDSRGKRVPHFQVVSNQPALEPIAVLLTYGEQDEKGREHEFVVIHAGKTKTATFPFGEYEQINIQPSKERSLYTKPIITINGSRIGADYSWDNAGYQIVEDEDGQLPFLKKK